MDPIEYASLPEGPKRDAEVLEWLQDQAEPEKFEFIWRVLRAAPDSSLPSLGLWLVESVQLKPIYLEVILEHGFVYGDASGVRCFYEATVNGLGKKKVIELVKAHIDDAPLIVNKMLYWLFILRENDELDKELKELRFLFEEKYPEFGSTRSTGIHATGE